MYNRWKKYIDKLREKQDIISQNTNCLFDTIVILEKKGWIYQI